MSSTLHISDPVPSGSSVDPAPSHLWIVLATLAFVAFTVPYTTNMVPWAYQNGMFPLRPGIYLLITSLSCIAVTLGRRPDFTKTTVLIILFQLAYLFDAIALRRFVHPSGNLHSVMNYGAALVTVVTLSWFLGSVLRLTLLPVLVSSGLTVVISSVTNLAEWFGLHEFTIVMGRAAGFHEDPNNSAIAIIIALAIFLTLNKNIWLSFAILALSFIAVALTLSRSGIIAEVLLSISFLGITFSKHPAKVTKALLVTVPVVLASLAFLLSNMSSTVLRENDIKNRLGALLGKDTQKMESGERMKDLKDGINAVRLRPVVGYGAGAGASKWQPHNQLVSTWIDGGIITAALFIGILASLSIKCLSSAGRGGLCLLTLFIFIPFSQILNTHPGYWMSVVIVIQLTSPYCYAVQWFKPSAAATNGNQPSQPATPNSVNHA